jgi:hypothetical protein
MKIGIFNKINALDAPTVELGVDKHATARANSRKFNAQSVPSLLAAGQNVAPTTTVSQKDADIAVGAITGLWHSDTAPVEFAPTFSSLPKEVQDSVEKADQAKTKGIFHPKSNTIWVALDRHATARAKAHQAKRPATNVKLRRTTPLLPA